MQRNSDRLRDFVERGLAKLEGREPRREFPPHLELMEENIVRTRRLAKRGLSELRREQAS
jgi:hypothetical protein